MTKWQIGSMAKWHNCIMVLWKEVLTFEILDVSDDDDVEELVVGDVGGPDRHHQVPEADERTVLVSEHSHDDVVLKKTHSDFSASALYDSATALWLLWLLL